MNFIKFRKLNIQVDQAYIQIKSSKLKDDRPMEDVFYKCYLKIKEQNKSQKFKEFLIYRYNHLRNDLSLILSIIFIMASTCIPSICFGVFGNPFNKNDPKLPFVILIAFISSLILMIGATVIFSAFIVPCVNIIHPRHLIKMQNAEIKAISKFLKKDVLIDQINKKKLLKKGLLESIITALISFAIWVVISLFYQ